MNALDHLSNVEMSQSQSALKSKSIPSCQSLNQAPASKKSKKKTEVAYTGSASTSSGSASKSCGSAVKSSSSASTSTGLETTITRSSIMKTMLTAMKQSLNIF